MAAPEKPSRRARRLLLGVACGAVGFLALVSSPLKLWVVRSTGPATVVRGDGGAWRVGPGTSVSVSWTRSDQMVLVQAEDPSGRQCEVASYMSARVVVRSFDVDGCARARIGTEWSGRDVSPSGTALE